MIEDLLDREKIRHNLTLYSRGMDRQDSEILASAYWPDGWDNHSIFVGLGADFAEWMKPVWPTMKMDHLLG
jgi:hypothetical protein